MTSRGRALCFFGGFVATLAAALVWATLSDSRDRAPRRTIGHGQIRFNGLGPERWAARAARYKRQREDLQRRLTRRVLEARRLRRALVQQPSSLEALQLASVVYGVSFETLYRRASCESTGQRPASPPSNRTLAAYAKNPSSTASGLLQFLDSTWASTPFARFSVFSPYANALAGGWMHGPAGRSNEWVCR